MTNTYDLEGTPINIVQQTQYTASAKCSIYPIHHQHTLRIDQLLRADALLVDAYIQVLAYQMTLIEECINRSVDQFLEESNGYFAVQA